MAGEILLIEGMNSDSSFALRRIGENSNGEEAAKKGYDIAQIGSRVDHEVDLLEPETIIATDLGNRWMGLALLAQRRDIEFVLLSHKPDSKKVAQRLGVKVVDPTDLMMSIEPNEFPEGLPS